jgi:hypothetical protein
LILIEGYWGTNAGLRASEVIEMLPGSFPNYSFQDLSENANFWGREVNDERYAIITDKDH